MMAAPTLGWARTPARVRRSWSVSGPMEWPQPSPWGKATMPSTWGGREAGSKLWAMSSAVWAAQLEAATTAT